MDTKDLQMQVSAIYAIVSSLNVSGDAVDVMAEVRARLRKLKADITELETLINPKADITELETLINPKGQTGDHGAQGAKEEVDDGGQDDRGA